MTSTIDQIAQVLDAVHIVSPVSFTWLGTPSPDLLPEVRRALTPAMARSCLHGLLRQQLYQDFYIRGGVTPAPRLGHEGGTSLATPFVEALSAANAGHGSWQGGWSLRGAGPAGATVSNGALTVAVQPDEYRPAGEGAPGPDDPVLLHFPKEARRISPGFYLAEGDLVPPAAAAIVRLYWHLRPSGAAVLMHELTARLNAARLPFRCKVLSDPDAYQRCDAGVLYLGQRDFAVASAILAEVYPRVAPHLDAQTPVFTRCLAPGLGLAEDPGDGESFGLHRCAVLAEGLIRAHERAPRVARDRLATVEATFAEAGIDLARPYLCPGAGDSYHLRLVTPPMPERAVPPPAAGRSFLEAALDLGRRLAHTALWHGDRCTWMTSDLTSRVTGRVVRSLRPLDPNLYAGASGVALFLAELAAQTGDRRIEETARGAMRQALASLETVRPEARIGLYTGWLGVAYVADRVGMLLGEPHFNEESRRLLARCLHERWNEQSLDLLTGLAGAIVAVLALPDAAGDDAVLDWTRSAGDTLLRLARRSRAGLSWRAPHGIAQPDLTGFSHGAAGIGSALLELFAATGDDRYRDGAMHAFAYERQWLDAATGNWADLRQVPRRTRPGSPGLTAMVAWCHGAPGIALARLRAWELTGDAGARAAAELALRTTSRAVALATRQGAGDCTPCHGLLGNADVLLLGARTLGEPALADQARDAARASIARYGDGARPWPCGGHTGEVPGLMLGLAGIGHVLLRLHDPRVPSVLLLPAGRREAPRWLDRAPALAAAHIGQDVPVAV